MSVLAIDTGTTGAAALIVTADGTVAGPEGWRIQPVFPAPGPLLSGRYRGFPIRRIGG